MIPAQQLEKAFQTRRGKLKGHKAKSRKWKNKKQKEETNRGQSIDPAMEGSAEAQPEKETSAGCCNWVMLEGHATWQWWRGKSPGEDRKPES